MFDAKRRPGSVLAAVRIDFDDRHHISEVLQRGSGAEVKGLQPGTTAESEQVGFHGGRHSYLLQPDACTLRDARSPLMEN